jgi:hypothetical protein
MNPEKDQSLENLVARDAVDSRIILAVWYPAASFDCIQESYILYSIIYIYTHTHIYTVYDMASDWRKKACLV